VYDLKAIEWEWIHRVLWLTRSSLRAQSASIVVKKSKDNAANSLFEANSLQRIAVVQRTTCS